MRLTREGGGISCETITALRDCGWNDSQIHDTVQVIAAFNYFTRLAHGLGVEPEDFMLER